MAEQQLAVSAAKTVTLPCSEAREMENKSHQQHYLGLHLGVPFRFPLFFNYVLPVGNITQGRGVFFYCYADYNQLYVQIDPM